MPFNTTFHVIFVGQIEQNDFIFQRIFKHVDIVTTQKDAMISIMARQDKSVPILLMIDIDQHLNLLEKICQSIQFDPTINIIPVACSNNDSSHLMIQCIQMGAVDYILKPFREPVLKTMFLNVYRDQTQNNNKVSKNNNTILSQFQDRLDSISRNNQWLTKTMIQHYTPKPTTRRQSMNTMTSERKEFLNRYICDWNFSPLKLDDRDLVQCVFTMLDQTFTQLPELNSLRIKDDLMYDFLFDVCNSYHNSNPYHNFRHAVDVMQSTWYFLCSMRALTSPPFTNINTTSSSSTSSILRPIDIFALLMASLGHDVGHPGVNNDFMITTATPLAVLYNDKSVLESYHAMAFFNLLCTSFQHANIDLKSHIDYKEFRKILIHSILCTDMGFHQDYLQAIRDACTNTTIKQDTKRQILCTAIMKCSDISNCTRPFDNAKEWAVILAEEFSLQGDLEHELGLPSVPINQRGQVSLPDFQLFFMNNIAFDLYNAVGQFVPEMKFCAENIRKNMDTWEKKKKIE